MDYGNGGVAVGLQSTHATRQIQTRDSEGSGLTMGVQGSYPFNCDSYLVICHVQSMCVRLEGTKVR